MRTLYIDLASHSGMIACVDDNDVIASDPVDHRIDDAELLTRVESVLKESAWSYQDLTHLACVIGPGGFMSLRVAVAFVNTLMHELRIPSVGIHLSDLYQSRITNQELRNIWIHSTKKSEIFIRDTGEPRLISVDELRRGEVFQNGAGWMGELIPEHRAIVDDACVEESPLAPIRDVLPGFLARQSYGRKILNPWYGRGW